MLNRTDKITFTSSANRYIDYTYDAGGNLIRKRQYDNVGGVATLQNTTDYLDGFVYVNSTLSYFPMPEGRVINNSGTLVQEFIIADQQGNARVSFQNNGSGTAVVKQENSYYGFGMALLNSPVGLPTVPNKQLYNGGSEWQNDYSNLPDYQQTFYRNYDAALGRWIGVDPAAESAESMTSYQYAGNNPILFNDPLGDAATGRYQGNINPPTDSSSPSIHLDNFVWDQLQQDMLDFFGAFNAAGDAADAAGSNDMASMNGSGSYSVFGATFLSAYDNLHTQSHNAFINNMIGGENGADVTNNGVAVYHYLDGRVMMESGSRHSYLVNQITDGEHFAWDFTQTYANQGGQPGFDMAAARAAGITIVQYDISRRGGYYGVVLNIGLRNTGQYDTKKFKFVQVVTQNQSGVRSTFIDRTQNDNNFPFFFTDREESVVLRRKPFEGQGFDGAFYDEPHRANPADGDSWSGTLFIIQTTAGGNNNVVFTINYGFTYSNGQVQPFPLTGH